MTKKRDELQCLNLGVPRSCFIIPAKILERLANDQTLTDEQRNPFVKAAQFEAAWREARDLTAKRVRAAQSILPTRISVLAAARPPSVLVFDCQQGTALPGIQIENPGSSTDDTAKRTFKETTAVVDFYQRVFGRNSIDNKGITLLSSIHYSSNYANAFWDGSQMCYGDGDGYIFIDFTKSNDVICHELTHGVTQYTANFEYYNQAGGLNESMSDVFGSMFRQWQSSHTVTDADWLIGKDIMGPGSLDRGFTCLRDLSNPAARHCIAPQPSNFSQYADGMDPHDSSGIPNFAFYKAAMAIGGNSWEKTGQIWYKSLAGSPPSPEMKMKTFADRTRAIAGTLFPGDLSIESAIDRAWEDVGL